MMDAMKKTGMKAWRAAGLLAAGLFFTGAVPAAAAAADGTAVPAQKTEISGSAEALQKSPGKHAVEVQLEYLDGRFFKERNVNVWNMHVLWQNRTVHHTGVSYGFTLQRALGYTSDDGIYRDSEAVGLGPMVQLRRERSLGGKFTGSIDGSGSLMLYNHAHPAKGRAYGFLWRIGPRLTYHATDRDAISLAYIFHHSSNGMRSHNPGYNGVGFSLGYRHEL